MKKKNTNKAMQSSLRNLYVLILSLILSMGTCWYSEGQSISELFINAPENIFPLLSLERKKELVDNYQKSLENDSLDLFVTNRLGGKSKILNINDFSFNLSLDQYSSIDIFSIQLVNKSYLIGLIKTSEFEPKQSTINFYNTNWELLESENIFPNVRIDNFLRDNYDAKTDSNQLKELTQQISLFTISYEIEVENGHTYVLAKPTSYNVLPENSKQLAKDLLKIEGIKLVWEGNKFVFTK